MRALFGALLVALLAAPTASAGKVTFTLAVNHKAPVVGEQTTVTISSNHVLLGIDPHVVVVAPHTSLRNVVTTLVASPSRPLAHIPQDGFEIPVIRVAQNRWRAQVRFPKAGRWSVLIGAVGPLPALGPALPPVVPLAVVTVH
jgi:hypothetical protein